MRLRSSGGYLVLCVGLACSGPAWGVDCPPPPDEILKMGEVGPVVNHMLKEESPGLAESCVVEEGQELDPTIAGCVDSLNKELDRRYGALSKKIDASLKNLTAIKLPVNPDGHLECPGKKGAFVPTKVTAAPINLPYHIAATGGKKQSQDMDTMIDALKLGSMPDKELSASAVRLSLGRGSTADYQRAVQRLACVSNPGDFETPDKAKATLARARIGIDCAGAVQTTLLDITGKKDTFQLGLKGPTQEAFTGQSMRSRHERYRHSKNPLTIRPGDIIPLDKPVDGKVGHVVIAQEVKFELAKKEAEISDGKDLTFETKTNDQLMKVKVASSWGNGIGPASETWVYNMRTKKWAEQKEDGSYAFDVSGPYNHPYLGQYRYKAFPK